MDVFSISERKRNFLVLRIFYALTLLTVIIASVFSAIHAEWLIYDGPPNIRRFVPVDAPNGTPQVSDVSSILPVDSPTENVPQNPISVPEEQLEYNEGEILDYIGIQAHALYKKETVCFKLRGEESSDESLLQYIPPSCTIYTAHISDKWSMNSLILAYNIQEYAILFPIMATILATVDIFLWSHTIWVPFVMNAIGVVGSAFPLMLQLRNSSIQITYLYAKVDNISYYFSGSACGNSPFFGLGYCKPAPSFIIQGSAVCLLFIGLIMASILLFTSHAEHPDDALNNRGNQKEKEAGAYVYP